jgi:hypothetical protein
LHLDSSVISPSEAFSHSHPRSVWKISRHPTGSRSPLRTGLDLSEGIGWRYLSLSGWPMARHSRISWNVRRRWRESEQTDAEHDTFRSGLNLVVSLKSSSSGRMGSSVWCIRDSVKHWRCLPFGKKAACEGSDVFRKIIRAK